MTALEQRPKQKLGECSSQCSMHDDSWSRCKKVSWEWNVLVKATPRASVWSSDLQLPASKLKDHASFDIVVSLHLSIHQPSPRASSLKLRAFEA